MTDVRTKRGFTIVELLLVIGVISVLITIVVTAASSVIRSSRSQRTSAMKTVWQSAIATWQAADRDGKWPGVIDNLARNGQSKALTQGEAQDVFRMIVQKSTGANGKVLPLVDPHGLFVAPNGAKDGVTMGRPYDEAHRGTSRSKRGLRVNDMEFGYPGVNSGRFYHFNIIYHAASDSVTVSTCCEKCVGADGCRNSKCQYCHRKE